MARPQGTKSPPFVQPFWFTPMDLNSSDEINELIHQRKIATWDFELDTIHGWRDDIVPGTRFLWWIVIPDTNTDETDNQPSKAKEKRVGHIGLSSTVHPPDPDLARPDRSVLTIKSFFLLPQYRNLGLGRASWLEVEDRARQIPECREIAIDTVDRRYATDDGPEWRGLLARVGVSLDPMAVLEDWYVRMGYVPFKRVKRYPLSGTDELLMSVFLRKQMK